MPNLIKAVFHHVNLIFTDFATVLKYLLDISDPLGLSYRKYIVNRNVIKMKYHITIIMRKYSDLFEIVLTVTCLHDDQLAVT